MPRLNRLARVLEEGGTAFGTFAAPEIAAALSLGSAGYDALIFETEHKPWDPRSLQHALQYLLDRRQIFDAQTLSPAVTPLVRIPPNGSEMSQWHAKQALDLGAFGVVWPHIATPGEAENAVAACRYPHAPGAEGKVGPIGVRGDSPTTAARYWGISNAEYYRRSGVWSLDEDGEILVAIMIESVKAIENLDDILAVPGIGLVMIGEGDLTQQLGVPRQYDHPTVLEYKRRVLDVCAQRDVAIAHPHVNEGNAERVLDEGYRVLLTGPVVSYPGLELGRKLVQSRSTN